MNHRPGDHGLMSAKKFLLLNFKLEAQRMESVKSSYVKVIEEAPSLCSFLFSRAASAHRKANLDLFQFFILKKHQNNKRSLLVEKK